MDLTELNAQQRAVVRAPLGPRLVVAGAGTGKTRTLVHRVAWLIEQGSQPRSIVLLTFTRRAAQEMLERCAQLIGHRAHAVRGGTFHAFAVRALRQHGSLLGYSRDFTIIDRSDAESLVGLVRAGLGLGGKARRFPQRRTVLKIISKQINTGRDLADIVDEAYPQYFDDVEDIARIAEGFIARKKQQNVMDFDDLLVRLDELLREHPEARMRIASGVNHLLVDEFQDTNQLQASITRLLSFVHNDVMVVGDEAQSIYGFRGADVANILDFPKLFTGAEVLKLEQNYRSTQPILGLANGILESATRGYGKVLFTEITGGELPAMLEVYDENEQADAVLSQVMQARDQGLALNEQAVLFRSGFHANILELALARAKVPFRKFGGIRFVEASHIKDLFSLLRLCANPRDGLAWYRVLQWFEGLGAKSAERMVLEVERSGQLDPGPWRSKKFGGAVSHLVGVLKEAEPLLSDLQALLLHLAEYYKPILERLHEDHRKRVRDLDTLRVLAERYSDLETFLAEVALDPPGKADLGESGADDDWLTLSTIHSAKGLEWTNVWVLQLGDGQFPSMASMDDDDSIEEERRLFYVACTRAKRRLTLCRPRVTRTRWGSAGQPGECILLDQIEMIDDLVDHERWMNRPAPQPTKPAQHPDIAAAEKRLADFLKFVKKKK
ncbi:MAG: DNA helicase-2/ATP-dependent DNA helicase PcrA [Kiritimatiellia bacterium]|jgi:DNA helicase-2/ATP-dependent DNA helicase PcrA